MPDSFYYWAFFCIFTKIYTMTQEELDKKLLYTHIGLASIVIIGGFFILQPLIKEIKK